MNRPDIEIRYGNKSGKYFTQWRFEELKDLLYRIVFEFGEKELIAVSDVVIWFDQAKDFHMLEFTANNKRIKVRLYKVFSYSVDGTDAWVACSRSELSEFTVSIRNATRR